jgi:hypothetical protein
MPWKVNYAEREHAKVLRDEVTEDPFFMGSVNQAFQCISYISYNLHRPGSTPQANKKGGGPGFPGEARRKCKYNREEHRWRCIAGADQALCGAAVAVVRSCA